MEFRIILGSCRQRKESEQGSESNFHLPHKISLKYAPGIYKKNVFPTTNGRHVNLQGAGAGGTQEPTCAPFQITATTSIVFTREEKLKDQSKFEVFFKILFF